jgi:hypothetical protein
MIRHLLVFLFISISPVIGEIIEIDKGLKINIPKDKVYYTSNILEDLKRNMEQRKFTKKEINYTLKDLSNYGITGKEVGYSITSETHNKNRLRQEDEFENDEFEIELQAFVVNKCSKKKNKECILRSILEFDDYFEHFYTHIGKNESPRLKKLNGLSDDQLATLSNKEIKKIRKSNSSKINYKYKKRYFKETGIRNIKITGDGFFYVESISSISTKTGVNYTETSWSIPLNNKEFLIKSNCYKEYCKKTKERMYDIIKPTFSINPNGIKTYDFQKKQDMIDLIQNVKNGYRIFRIASLLFGVIV